MQKGRIFREDEERAPPLSTVGAGAGGGTGVSLPPSLPKADNIAKSIFNV